MKKFFCLMVTLTVILSACAYAESVPSKTTNDMIQIEIITEETAAVESGTFIAPVRADDAAYAEILEVSAAEIQKMAESTAIEAYFGEVQDAEGNAVLLRDLLGTETLNCFEFHPIAAGGFEQPDSATMVRMKFATPYAEEEKVLVLIGIVAETGIEWTVYPAEVDEAGQVIVVLDHQIILQIQSNKALMAIVSK